ncbi:MAG: SpoIIE family protein phosphatase, partial [bacterium]|nr:SpoIIE family protein phosphatase [bacterium]
GSQIINEPETFYYKYKTLIWSVAVIFVFLIAFILILLFNIRKRQRAQKGLQDIIGSLSSVLELGSTGEIKRQLVETIQRVIFLNKSIKRIGLFNYSGDFKTCDTTQLTDLSPQGATEADNSSSDSLIRQSIEQGRSVVKGNECVALFKSNSIPGNVIYLKGKRRFDEMDQNLLEILTSNTSMAMETLEKNKIQESLETARKIQLSMLPHDFAPVTQPFDVDIHAELIPAKEVGGDLYDVFAIDEDHLCFAVGDVSDKGVPAALFMAMAKTLIRSNAESSRRPHEILRKVNNELARDNEQCMFVTLFLALFEPKTQILYYANGGHNPPYLLSAEGRVDSLPLEIGTALGVIEDAPYQPQSIQLQAGDGLFVYTDGITEAMNSADQLYGEARLEQLLLKNRENDPNSLTEKVIRDVREFAKGTAQSDDITVLFTRIH